MAPARRHQLMPVEIYLAGESTSPTKHEYVGGVVSAMAGARNVHNLVASNVLGILHAQLRGRRCRPFNSDTKIRIRTPTQTRFYYPDVSVICRPNPPRDWFQDEPAVIVEVVSEDSRRVDEGEKKDSYLMIPSLLVYVLLEQEAAAAVVLRRADQGFVREVYEGLETVIPLKEVDADLSLADAYEGVDLDPQAGELPPR